MDGAYRLKLENEMMEHQAYLQIHMEMSEITFGFGPPEKAARFTWRDVNLSKEYMRIVHQINLKIDMI